MPVGAGPCLPIQQLSCEQLVALGLSYPYPRQPGSFLFVNGVAYPYVTFGHRSLMDATVRAGDTVLTARALLDRLGLARQVGQALTPVLAYGANANVGALTRKFVGSGFPGPAVVPVTKGTLRNFDVTWSPDLAFNGAMPTTIVSSPGTTVSVWVTWLDRAELGQMKATEGVGTQYSYGFLSCARLDMAGPATARPGLYVGCFGALQVHGRVLAVNGVPASRRRFAAADSSRALARAAAVLGWRARCSTCCWTMSALPRCWPAGAERCKPWALSCPNAVTPRLANVPAPPAMSPGRHRHAAGRPAAPGSGAVRLPGRPRPLRAQE